jgi:Transposase DDE domain
MDLTEQADTHRFRPLVQSALADTGGPGTALDTLTARWLYRTMRAAELAGADPAEIVRQAVASRDMAGARDIPAVIDARMWLLVNAMVPRPRDKNGNVTDDAQKAVEGKPTPFRAYGKSKDHRDELPQVVIEMAVTRDGILVRVLCWPGSTAHSALIRQVKKDMRDWALSRVGWVADRGFTSADNRRYLRSGDQHYIIGEKLRSGSAEAQAALSRQDRYQDVAANLRVKEVHIAASPLANIDGTYGRAIRNIGRPVVRAAGRSVGRRRAARPPRPWRGAPRRCRSAGPRSRRWP